MSARLLRGWNGLNPPLRVVPATFITHEGMVYLTKVVPSDDARRSKSWA